MDLLVYGKIQQERPIRPLLMKALQFKQLSIKPLMNQRENLAKVIAEIIS
jgi:hypothetical protein